MTLAELRIAALQEAGILASGESASAEDDQLVARKYGELYDMLLTKGLVAWASDAQLPEYADTPLTMMLAAYIAPAFGVTGQRLAELRLSGLLDLSPPSIAERALRKQLSKNYVTHPAQPDYF